MSTFSCEERAREFAKNLSRTAIYFRGEPQISKPFTSFYRWEGEFCRTTEVSLSLFVAQRSPDFSAIVNSFSTHEYQLPEILLLSPNCSTFEQEAPQSEPSSLIFGMVIMREEEAALSLAERLVAERRVACSQVYPPQFERVTWERRANAAGNFEEIARQQFRFLHHTRPPQTLYFPIFFKTIAEHVSMLSEELAQTVGIREMKYAPVLWSEEKYKKWVIESCV